MAFAESLVATRTVRSHDVLTATDLALVAKTYPGALTTIEAAIGMEARVILYPGRPIHSGDIGPPALIERNQIVLLTYLRGGLKISTDARALDRAGVGDLIRVMNLASRTTVSGVVMADGTVAVGRTY